MARVLRAERVWVETFTGLRIDQFGRLLRAVWERGGEGCGWGRPWRLPLAERVLLMAVYYRTNLTTRQLAPLFGVSPATVCRGIQGLGPLLALEPTRTSQDAVERLWIVDGTLVPVRDRKVGAPSRNYRLSANVQVIMDAETRLVVATARPVPGNTADAKAWRDSGLAEYCEGVTVLGDGADGLPLVVGISAGNVHDSEGLKPVIASHQTQQDPYRGRYFKAQRLQADKAYDVPHLHRWL
ncbi:transposase family protein [Streptomyces bobili]|uniref:transposase family protein n=1 Tax=Streptomyces bobili TaxID=67280 RepID=UPI003664332C